ncbi:DUF7503 family protein [Halorussus halophilus]|nr:hypothetical protein [Halorussus halophilus]
MNQNMIAEYLRENPKAMGVLFSACLLLMEAGNVAANGASAHAGP